MGVLVLVDHQSNHLYSSDVLLYQKEYSKEYVINGELHECNLLLLFGCIISSPKADSHYSNKTCEASDTYDRTNQFKSMNTMR